MSGLGADPGRRAWFERYLEAFNRGDLERVGSYYDEAIEFHGQAATLQGRAALLGFYREVMTRVTETVEILSFAGSADRIAAELRTTLEAKADWLELRTGPLRQGERRQSVNFIFYDVRDNRFTRVRSARFQPLPEAPR